MFDKDRLQSFWEGRSVLERRLILFLLVLSIVLIILFLFMIIPKSDDVCVSKECVSAATHILDYVDQSARPCDDFYQFICGSYVKKAIEYNKPQAIKKMDERTKNQIESFITDDPEKTSTYSLKLERQFYKSCMNTSAIEMDENDTFLTLLDAIGGWPVIKGNFWDGNVFDWKLTMIKARKLGLSFQKFIGLDIINIDEQSNVIEILPPDDVDYISYEIMEPFVEVMRDTAILLHAPSLGINAELRHVVHFQNELFRIITRARNSSIEAKNMQIFKLQEKFSRISWLQFLNNLLSGAAVVKETDYVSLRSEQYLIDLEVLLLKTSKRVQANYIIWKTVEKFIPFLTENIRRRYEKFQRQYLDKNNVRKSRRDVCIELSKVLFTDVAEIEYVRKYTDPETKKVIKQIFLRVKEEMLKRLKSSTRLGVKLEEEVEEALQNTTIHIGGSEQIFNVEETEKHLGYNDLAFFDDDLVKMVTKVSVNRINHLFAKIENGDDDEYGFIYRPFTVVNAYYRNYPNLLILPAPFLQDIFYNKNRPNSMNYGALVTTIGHEFTHSLGKLGNKTYEQRGDYYFEYNQAFFDAFGNSSRCFEDQYRHFYNRTAENPAIAVNTNETLEENIADFVGTEIAYNLYQEYVEEHGTESRLPGVNFTPNQMFWIMSGTFLCEKPEADKEEHFHAAAVYRINYRLRNLPQFARDFHCPTGSFMNPEEKCSFF